MALIKKTLWVADYRKHRMYRKGEEFKVIKIKNSTYWCAGLFISESEVNGLIHAGWDVIITENK